MNKEDLKTFSNFAKKAHEKANCEYDGKSYDTHLEMVEGSVDMYETVFLNHKDYIIARAAASGHDLIEDAQLSFNDVKNASSRRVAQVVLAVTDVHEENRLLRHLFTMGKTVKDYIAIIVKMADMRGNGLYSKVNGSSMYKKYLQEYDYRRPIFKKALGWYKDHFDQEVLEDFWEELDIIHDGEPAVELKSKFDLIKYKHYVRTYTKNGRGGGCDDDRIIVKDLLYGIGISLDEDQFSHAGGYQEFLKHINKIH